MSEEDLYELWMIIEQYVHKEKDDLLLDFLYYLHDNDYCDIDRFKDIADENGELFIVDTINENHEMFE